MIGTAIILFNVRPVERRGDLDRGGERLADCERAVRQPIRETPAFEILHDEVRSPVVFTDVVQPTDMRMVELRNGAGLSIEALTELRVRRKNGSQNRDGDRAIEPRV